MRRAYASFFERSERNKVKLCDRGALHPYQAREMDVHAPLTTLLALTTQLEYGQAPF